jgi:hypothetical protein
MYNFNNFFFSFKLIIGSVFLHVSPTYQIVDFKKKLLELYKSTKIVNISYDSYLIEI